MPYFSYYGRTIGGDERGHIEASSKAAARASLESRGVVPYSLTQLRLLNMRAFWHFMNILDILFTQNVILSDALKIMSEQNDKKLSSPAKLILAYLGEGFGLPDALIRTFKIADPRIIQIIRIGSENSGLPTAVSLVLQANKRMIRRRQELTKALAYPAFVLVIALAAIVIVFDYVLPEFGSILDVGTMTASQALIYRASGRGYDSVLVLFWVTLGAYALFHAMSLHAKSMRVVMYLIDGVPFIKNYFCRITEAQYVNAMALALNLQADIVNANRMAQEYLSNAHHSKLFSNVEANLLEGSSFRSALEKTGVFRGLNLAQIDVAERSNSLRRVFQDMDTVITMQREQSISLVVQIVGPVSILALGILIYFIAMIVLTPMMSIQEAIGQ